MSSAKKIFLFFCLVCVFLLSANFVLALEIHYPDILGHHVDDTSTFAELVCYFFALGMDLAFFIAVIVIAYGGIYYLVSYGRGKFTSEAKEWIKAGVTGLLVVVCASLIAYTINPTLNTCKLDFLPGVSFNPFNWRPNQPTVPVVTYDEIPIGTLTENLLTRTMECYAFDQEGNPVDGNPETQDILEPTYINHDRADCLVQLIDGSQKRGQVIASLSNEIIKLMNQCSCLGKCDPSSPCQEGECDPPVGPCPGGQCLGPCAGASCQQKEGTLDCCPTPGINPATGELTISYKEKIEHGPIEVSVDIGTSSGIECKTKLAEYAGLDEFRCPNPIYGEYQSCDNIKGFVESRAWIDGRTVTVINPANWGKLNLIQGLTYFKEKIEDIKKSIANDKDILDQARTTLNKCYLAITYVDFLKIYQETNQQEKIIRRNQIFSDVITNEPVDISRYCTGFNYSNSSCLKKCNHACPDTSQAALNLYQNSAISIEDAYLQRPCIYSTENFQTFEDCIISCQIDCADICSQTYLECSDEYNFCISHCADNSQCVLDNAGICLFDEAKKSDFENCANNTVDYGNTDYCVNRTYSCKDGSDQYAGYPDCAESSNTSCIYFTTQEECEALSECAWDGKSCSQNHSASFFYDNPNYGKCYVQEYDAIDPFSSPDKGSVCYSSESGNAPCLELCPEVSKCPASSFCPNCPCDQLSDPDNPTEPLTLSFSIPGGSIGTYFTTSEQISAHQMASPQCNEYSYNDDPLTFYCEENWSDPQSISKKNLNPETPVGQSRVCPTQGEVPIGQTVDDAKKWTEKLINDAERMQEKIESMLNQMSKAGEAYKTSPIQDYCKCNAKFEDNEPICKTGCQYEDVIIDRRCVSDCIFIPCNGNPCQQIIDYLSELWNDYKDLKLFFTDFYTTMLQEPRSDIMKELSYSRQVIDDCSLVSNVAGLEAVLLGCTRVQDELIAPINAGQIIFNNEVIDGYCYGKDLGELFDAPLTDNWFCCQLYDKNSALAK